MGIIYQRGIVTHILKGNKFEIGLQDIPEHKVQATLCGKMLKKRITLVVGDEVSLELSPYDLNKGRITWRHS